MNIFISVYHLVRKILLLPVNLFHKTKEQTIRSERNKEKEDRENKLKRETLVNAASIDSKSIPNQIVDPDELAGQKKRLSFDYVVKNDIGQTIKSSFDAYSMNEVKAFLINEGYEIVRITAQKKWNMELKIPGFGGKLKSGELSFALTQLSTYIKAGIPLIDSVRILAKQTTVPAKRKIYERIVYDLVTGENFSKALENQEDIFPRLLINMVKTAEMTGDLPGTLDEMSDYYTSIEQTRKQMISALTYPTVVFTIAVLVVSFCLIYVVPNFVQMYEGSETALPSITNITISISDFLAANYLYIILALVLFIIAYRQAYKNVKSFRRTMQNFYMKFPVVGNIIIYNEVTMFTKTFSSLLNHSVHISDSMEILSKISNNEIYKEIIMNTLNTLSRGGKISESFRGQWAFPVVAYEMLITGESTGQLGLMMEKVANHYGELHRNAITSVKSLVEPLTICFLAIAVGFILLSIVVPMFGLYGTVGA